MISSITTEHFFDENISNLFDIRDYLYFDLLYYK